MVALFRLYKVKVKNCVFFLSNSFKLIILCRRKKKHPITFRDILSGIL